jgi:phosphoribosylamine--glycine ligase
MSAQMKVGLLGSGGREHALYEALMRSSDVRSVRAMPGNGGMELEHCRQVDINSFSAVLETCRQEEITLLVVGPEQPLVDGIVDYFAELAPDIKVFGPSRKAALLEGSKIFCKDLCVKYHIRTPRAAKAFSFDEAKRLLKITGAPIVVKADGLCAAGKGVVVADTIEVALEAAENMLVKRTLGRAGERILLEEKIIGHECSVMAFCDGVEAVLMPPARDHKRVYDHDKGPNTGGMGAYSPVPDVEGEFLQRIKRDIIDRLMHAMRQEGKPYHGIMYAGLMITPENEPYLLEVNCRFGDPETQVVLPGLKSDLPEILLACTEEGGLSRIRKPTWDCLARVGVVLTTHAYPASSLVQSVMRGVTGALNNNALVYHAGTKRLPNGTILMNGGRLMCVVGAGATIAEAREHAYKSVEKIHFPGRYRKDIAAKV